MQGPEGCGLGVHTQQKRPKATACRPRHIKTTPEDYNLFLKPHNNNASAIALQLWDCCPKDFQTILRSNGMGNDSTKQKMLTKMNTHPCVRT